MLLVFIIVSDDVSFPLYQVILGSGFPSAGQEIDAASPTDVSIMWPSLIASGGS